MAAWKHAARAELAADLQLDYAAVLSGLIRAFDRVPHERLARQAGRYKSNLLLFRLALAAYGLALVAGVVSVYVVVLVASRGVTAGWALATVELRRLMIERLDEASWSCALASFTVCVDDMNV